MATGAGVGGEGGESIFSAGGQGARFSGGGGGTVVTLAGDGVAGPGGGGGGGYSGGGGGGVVTATVGHTCGGGGGGGGSFNAGTNQVNQAGVGTGDGSVTITYVVPPPGRAGVTATNAAKRDVPAAGIAGRDLIVGNDSLTD